MTAALVQLQCLPQAAGSRRKRIFFFLASPTFLWVIAEAADLSARGNFFFRGARQPDSIVGCGWRKQSLAAKLCNILTYSLVIN